MSKDSPAPATLLIDFLRTIPHWCRYHFPDPESRQATSLQFFDSRGRTTEPRWLATIDYTKPRERQVSCRADLGFHPQRS